MVEGSDRFFHKKSSKNCPPGGVLLIPPPEGAAERFTIFECEASAQMDGMIVAVAHDEFRGMGLRAPTGFWGRGRWWSM